MENGVYPTVFQPFRGVGKRSSRQAFLRAPTFHKCNSEALGWRPQPIPSTHTVLFFPSALLGITGPGRWRGRTDHPFWPQAGWVWPHKSTKCIYSIWLDTISPIWPKTYPLSTTCDTLISDYKLTPPRPRRTAQIEHWWNIQESRIVMMFCLRRNLGTATYVSNLVRRSRDVGSKKTWCDHQEAYE